MAALLRRMGLVLTLVVGLLLVGSAPALALTDPEDGPEPPALTMPAADFILLQPGDLACTGVITAGSQVTFVYMLVNNGPAQRRAKFTVRHITSPTTEEITFFMRLDPTPAGVSGVITTTVTPGLYRACVRNPVASAATISVKGTLSSP